MAKKESKIKAKSSKKLLIVEIEGKISESLKEFPKRSKGRKYQKKIHRASKILVKTLAIKPVKIVSTKDLKKSNKNQPVAAESVSR